MSHSIINKPKILITGATGSVGESVIEHIRRKYPSSDLYGTYNSSIQKANDIKNKYSMIFIKIDALKTIDFDSFPEDISILINAAGVNLSSAKCEETTIDLIENTCDINLRMPMLMIQRYLPYMMKYKWGRIVNVNSIWGIRGSTNNLSYNISKHALAALTKTVALEYFKYGITVNEVCPGPIESNMINKIIRKAAKEHDTTFEEQYVNFCESLRMKRMVSPSEVASLVVFLCSEEASGINGTSIPVDCGMTI